MENTEDDRSAANSIEVIADALRLITSVFNNL